MTSSADLEIGVDVLHVVAVFQGFEQLEEAGRGFLVDRRRGLRPPHQPRRLRRAEALLERVAHRVEIVGAGEHDMALVVALDIVGAGLDRRLEHVVGAGRGGRVDDLADPVEHEADAVGLAERARRTW